jgi:predicted exporter
LSERLVFAWIWAIVVCSLLAHTAYLWFGGRLAPDTDILTLLPAQERDPVLQQAFTRMVDSAQQRLIVLVGADDWAQAGRAADAYRAVLAGHTDLLQFTERGSDQTQRDWLASLGTHRLNLLTAQGEAALHDQPKQYWVDIALTKLYSPLAGLPLGAWRDDPFGLFGDWVQARAQETPVRPRDGRLFVGAGQRQFVVMPLMLRVPVFSTESQRAVMPLLEHAGQAAKRIAPQVEVVVAGVILHAAAASAQAKKEMSIIGAGSTIGIVLLTWLTFRRFYPILLVLLSISVGCLGALSLCWWLFDRVHILTLVFGASLIGVAQDYGIYFLCNRLGAGAEVDSRQLLQRLLPGLALSLVTTVIGYLGLVWTPFPGLRQMALFSALGLVLAWLTVVFWFPELVRSSVTNRAPLPQAYVASLARWPRLRPNRSTLIVALLFIAFVVYGVSLLNVDDDIRLLQNPPKNLIDDQIKVSRLLDTPTPVQFYIIRGATAEAVLQREEMLKQRLDSLVEKHIISGYYALSNWVPSLRAQTAHRQLIDQTLLNKSGPLAMLAARLGEDSGWVATTRRHLLGSGSPLSLDDFLRTQASEPWRHLWLGPVGGGYASIVAPRGLGKAVLPLLRTAASELDGVRWVDKVDEISSVLGRYRQYMSWAVLFSYIAVYGLLYLRYHSAVWRVLTPTALAALVTLALLGMAGQHLQLFHILALLLVLGIGVDYGIFLHEHPIQDDHAGWLAVGLSALSTLLSFGLLSLSQTPALQAFGLVMLIGIATVWVIVPCLREERSPI